MSVPEKQAPKNALKSILNYQWIVMNIPFFLFLAFLAILYIANGHQADKTVRAINAQQKNLKELDFEYKTLKADLMRRGRAEQIENVLKPYGLVVAKEMPIHIPIENRIPVTQTPAK
ncbi:MAG: hypothetical protein RLZ95_1579 [Bacteroidota bacterium]|jgi:cell division protein FtsL